jgi:hypothetical protein
MKRNSPKAILWSAALLIGAVTGCNAAPTAQPATAPAGRVAGQWTLSDYFHHDWHNELVTYPVDAKTAANKNLMLASADGTAHSYQWLKDGTQTKIAFLADVPADGTSTYRLAAGQPQAQTDLKIEETADAIRLTNDQTGVAIRKVLGEGEAPIAAIRLASGNWVGGSQRVSTPALQSYQATVTERGPVLCEVLCEAKFEGGKTWRMRFRLLAHEPVVTVSEASSVGAGAWWRLRIDNGFSPTHLFHRNPLARTILTTPLPTKNGTFGVLEPWVIWSEPTHGAWLSFYNDTSDDMLALGALDPSLWVDVDKLRAKVPQSKPQVPVSIEDGGIYAGFDLTGGLRRWTIAALGKTESLKVLGGKDSAVGKLTLPHSYIVKYGDFPLDRVKDYVLDWPDKAAHPRLLVAKDDIARLRRTYQVNPNRLAALQGAAVPTQADAFPIYLETGDEKIGRNLVPGVMRMLQAEIDGFMNQDTKGSLGAWPHMQQNIVPAFNAVDMVWSAFTPEERKRVKAQAALIGYAVDSPDYWSVERGFHANPNMTTMVAGYQAAAGYLLADHPMSDQWVEDGMAEAKNQIENWSDENGGWLEAPHYASVSYDHLLGMFLMARGKDNGALLYSDKMKKVAEFFARIATPPDVNVGGIRHHPRIGNTWLDEPSGLFGVVAALWKERDPQFASEMQWMYQQQGSNPYNCIGGGCGSLEGVLPAFHDPSVPAKKPDYTSTLFPQTGVSLRNAVDDRETQLYMIAGSNHQHYDDDSGSITIWGKGRIVASEFAYGQRPEMAARVHSMVEGGGRSGLMKVTQFKTTPNFDSVRGAAGGWQRQIAFVKDSDMMAPNYFVLRDTIGNAAATWRLWPDGKINILDAQGKGDGVQLQAAQVEGRNDVDTDIALITSGGATLGTDTHSSTTFGLGADGLPHQKVPVSLTALTAALKGGQDVLTVIYPRLKTQKPPKIQILAEGRGVKIEHEAGTDYVFLSDRPFTFDEGDIHFEGTSGLVKIRGEKVDVVLGEAGKLAARGQSTSATP